MTTETDKASEAQQEEEEQSFLPTVLAGAGILAVAALLIFWPADEDPQKAQAERGDKTAEAKGAQAGKRGGKAAGVGARPVDEATQPPGSGRRNPAIKMPAARRGMAPAPEVVPTDPPESASVEDKIAFYEKRLEQAQRDLEMRKKAVERLPSVKARIEASANPEEGLAAFEKRKQVVENNFDRANRDIDYIEGKLAELRGT